MTGEDTAAEEVQEGAVAFRLAKETPVYEAPDASAKVLGVLPAGALVTVHEDMGDFLHIITPDERFGYIAAVTAVTPVAPPSLDAAPDDSAPQTVFPESFVEQAGAESEPAGDGVQHLAAPQRRDDSSFTPARPLEPSERVLIYDRIGANRRSSVILLALFVLFLAAFFSAIGVFITYYGGAPEDPLATIIPIAVLAGVLSVVLATVMYYSASAAVLAISGAHQVTKQEEPDLYRVVENLSIGSGLPMPKVWVIEDSAPNALATGRNPQNAHVAATRGLLEKLGKSELEAVMAHEMSHVGNYDIRTMTVIAVAVGLVALLADLLLRFTWYGAGARSSNREKGGGAIGLLILVAAILFIVISPIAASIIRLALSRQREYLADASGALLCRNPNALADALAKISADPEPLEVANKATAHLYFADPLKGHESFLNGLFSTHPPVEERIRLLRAMA